MRIGSHDTGERVLVIAEIGNNHEGDFGRARDMVAAAAAAGADAVKFQTIVPERLVSALQTERIAQLSRFALSRGQYAQLAEEAVCQGVLFLSTPFDLDSARFLAPLVPAFKIASSDNTFFPLLAEVAATGKPVLLSAGLCDKAELAESIGFLRQRWNLDPGALADRLAVLHCVTAYPTPAAQAGLAAIRGIAALGVTPGYSDHTLGTQAAVLSVACGARIVEKHFTLDKTRDTFRDHQLSSDPADLADMVRGIRLAESMLGREEICCAECESGNLAARRSIVAARDLPAGVPLAEADIDWVRPAGGLAPGQEALVLGRTLARAVARGEMILTKDLKD